MGTQVLGISVDSQFANKAYAKEIGVNFPLLSDFQKTVSKLYGIFYAQHGFANRTTFVVDKQGIIRHIDRDAAALDPSGAHPANDVSLIEHRARSGRTLSRCPSFAEAQTVAPPSSDVPEWH